MRVSHLHLFSILLLICMIIPVCPSLAGVPEDFIISATCGGKPPWAEQHTWKIEANGKAEYRKWYSDLSLMDKEEVKTGYTVPENGVQAVWDSVLRQNFFSLPSQYSYKDVHPGLTVNDGLNLGLYVTGGGRHHRMHLDNAAPPAVEEIFRVIYSTIPDEINFGCSPSWVAVPRK